MQLAPSALHETGQALAHLLGPWQTADPDHDGVVHLAGPLDRHIGMRLIHNGSTVQLWATGGTQPTSQEPTGAVVPLPHGDRWHHPVHLDSLTEEQDPAAILYTAINDNLLPVFDTKPNRVGHRPWEPDTEPDIEADVEATVQAAAGVEDQAEPEPQAPADQPAPQPKPAPEPKAPVDELAAKRTRRATADPAAEPKPKPARPARKRTPAKADPAAAAAEPKVKPARPARKRTTTKPATS